MKLLKISEMAKLNGISVQSLQYYEKIGLFFPWDVDEENGYRYYHINQSSELDHIKFLQALGFSLETIKPVIFGEQSQEELFAMLDSQEDDLEKKIRDIMVKKQMLGRHNQSIAMYNELKDKEGVEFVGLPSRRIMVRDMVDNIYEMTIEEYEHQLRKFKSDLGISGVSNLYFYNVGSIMSVAQLQSEKMHSSEFFVLVDNDFHHEDVRRLPAAKYAVIYCNSFEEELESIAKLMRAIKKHGMVVAGEYLCEVIYEPHAKQGERREMFLRLQVPVVKGE